jgi:hypothetical protein
MRCPLVPPALPILVQCGRAGYWTQCIGGCDGQCGPHNGCNCGPCHELDVAAGFSGTNTSHLRPEARTAAARWTGGPRRATVGDRVRLAPGRGDEGPLRVGEDGVIEEDDGSSVPFKVRGPRGGLYWFKESDLVLATEPAAVVRNSEGRVTHLGRDGITHYCDAQVGKAGYWTQCVGTCDGQCGPGNGA